MYIEIDCAPGTPRPDGYFKVICEKLGIEYFAPASTFFGNWTWEIPELNEEQREIYDSFVPDYIKGLHSSGKIRYGSW